MENFGAVTWGNGMTGIKGVVSATNSLVGSKSDSFVGSGGVTILTTGNYVVSSPTGWDTVLSIGRGDVVRRQHRPHRCDLHN